MLFIILQVYKVPIFLLHFKVGHISFLRFKNGGQKTRLLRFFKVARCTATTDIRHTSFLAIFFNCNPSVKPPRVDITCELNPKTSLKQDLSWGGGTFLKELQMKTVIHKLIHRYILKKINKQINLSCRLKYKMVAIIYIVYVILKERMDKILITATILKWEWRMNVIF